MHRRLALATWFAAVWVGVAGAAPPTAVSPTRRLLLVSIDGLSWPVLQRSWARVPNLARLAAAGSSGPISSVFPALTWPAHTSLATASWPSRHGVLGGRYWDRSARKVVEYVQGDQALPGDLPTLWSIAKAQGLSTAALMWPLTSKQASLDWNLPELHHQIDFERGCSPGLLTEWRDAGLPVGQLGRIGREEMFLADSFVRDAALQLIDRHQPAVLLLHFLSIDAVAHLFGPDAKAVDWALELVDRYLGEVLGALDKAHLRETTDVLVVSDHGFHTVHKFADPEELLGIAGVRTAKLGLAINGQALFVSTRNAAEAADIAEKLRAHAKLLPEVAAVLSGEALQRMGLPGPDAQPNAPDLVVLAQTDVFWIAKRGRAYRGPLGTLGMHGSPPGPPEGQAILVAAGPHLRAAPARQEPIRMVDVGALAASLIGASWPAPVDGQVPTALLAPPPLSPAP